METGLSGQRGQCAPASVTRPGTDTVTTRPPAMVDTTALEWTLTPRSAQVTCAGDRSGHWSRSRSHLG